MLFPVPRTAPSGSGTWQPVSSCIPLRHAGPVSTVAICPDGRHALSGSDDRTLRLWNIEHRVCRAIVPLESSPLAIALAPTARPSWSAIESATSITSRFISDPLVIHPPDSWAMSLRVLQKLTVIAVVGHAISPEPATGPASDYRRIQDVGCSGLTTKFEAGRLIFGSASATRPPAGHSDERFRRALNVLIDVRGETAVTTDLSSLLRDG